MSFREPMFLIIDPAGHALGAVAVENGRWVGHDTAGRTLFDRKDQAGAVAAARRMAGWFPPPGTESAPPDPGKPVPNASATTAAVCPT